MGVLPYLSLALLGVFFFIPMLSGPILILFSSWGWDIYQGMSFQNGYGEALTHPQFFPALFLTLRTALISSSLSLLLVYFIAGRWVIHPQKSWGRLIPLWLSYPHLALAIGLVFLISPSGFLVRWLGAPFALQAPLLWETYQDPFGLSLILALTMKETVFLLFMAFSSLSQIDTEGQLKAASSLGYDPGSTWLRVIWPQVYRGIRFPFFIVLSYSFSAIDMSIVLAGKTPPPLAVLILDWFNDPNLDSLRMSSAAAVLLVGVFAMTLLIWRGMEKLFYSGIHHLIFLGHRQTPLTPGPLSSLAFLFLSTLMILSLIMNGLWSVTRSWPFPYLFPTLYTLDAWNFFQHTGTIDLLSNTLILAGTTTVAALGMAVILLEMNFHLTLPNPLGHRLSRTLIFLPLLLPSISFYLGIKTFFLISIPEPLPWFFTGIGHFLMVFPYVILTLEKPYLAYNQAFFSVAQTLSRSNLKAFLLIKIPMLKKPLLASLAIGLSVSVMDYLATVILSGGRISTITTEAVQLSDGGNLRIRGFFAILQTLVLAAVFFIAHRFSSPRYPSNMR